LQADSEDCLQNADDDSDAGELSIHANEDSENIDQDTPNLAKKDQSHGAASTKCPTKKGKDKKLSLEDECLTQAVSAINQIQQSRAAETEKAEEDIYRQYVASQLKSLKSHPQLALLAKHRIDTVLFEIRSQAIQQLEYTGVQRMATASQVGHVLPQPDNGLGQPMSYGRHYGYGAPQYFMNTGHSPFAPNSRTIVFQYGTIIGSRIWTIQ